MSKLFETSDINGMRLANRFVRSATWEGMAADDGTCTPQFKDLYTRLAEGGVGLIITSHTYVRPDGKGSPRQLGIDRDELIDGLQDFTRSIHTYDSRVAVEISHAGILTNEKLTEQIPLVVSSVEGYGQSPDMEMTVEDIERVKEKFVMAAVRAQRAGFDGIELNAACNHLLNSFLSRAWNKRQDAYGCGSLESRLRIVVEVYCK